MRSYSQPYTRGVKSQLVHVPRTPVVASHRARSHSFSRKSHRAAKGTVLTTIVAVTLMVVGFIFFNLIATPEYLTKREIESITKDYYENYFYLAILNNNSLSLAEVSNASAAEEALKNLLSSYVEPGFARLTLRQLLLFDDHRHGASASTLAEYCDLDKTQIKIYPNAPFTSHDYHVDYTYSCKF